jgi:uncharacterized protein (TIGR02466 family)
MTTAIENYVLFPTLVKRVRNFLTQKQCDDIIKHSKNKGLKPHLSLTNQSVSTHSEHAQFLDSLCTEARSCLDVKDRLYDVVKAYSDETGMDFRDISNSWVNFQTQNSRLLKHTHPLSCISGAVYLSVDSDSSKIYFYNPNPFVEFTSWTKGTYKDYSHSFYWFKPENGDLLVFPSWLSHGSDDDINMTKDRAVLSFNTCL